MIKLFHDENTWNVTEGLIKDWATTCKVSTYLQMLVGEAYNEVRVNLKNYPTLEQCCIMGNLETGGAFWFPTSEEDIKTLKAVRAAMGDSND